MFDEFTASYCQGWVFVNCVQHPAWYVKTLMQMVRVKGLPVKSMIERFHQKCIVHVYRVILEALL